MYKQTENAQKPNSNDTISLAEAEKWTKEWMNPQSSYNKQKTHTKIKAFNIPIDDFKGILSETGVKSVRAYMGVEIKKDGTFEEKLVIVGVDKNNNDMLPSGTTNKGNIYDFTYPCPSACDPSSPLNS